MSDEKSLGDDLNDMLGDAKDEVKKAADRVSEKAGEFAGEAKEALGGAKEKASEFAEDAKESAKEFSEDAKHVLSDGKNIAIIAHITLIGWIIALVMNSNNKNEFGSFYIRQVLGIIIIAIVTGFIPLINIFGWILCLVLWLMSLIGALNGEKKPIFLLGVQFQEWFKSL